MEKREFIADIITKVVASHNRLANIPVKGEGAILMGETLKDLRALVDELQQYKGSHSHL